MGSPRLTAHAKTSVFTMVTSSNPSDTLLSALLEDDHVALLFSSLESILVKELCWLANQPDCPSGIDVKFSTMSAAHAGARFAAERIFFVARQYPWKLILGDIRANLEELKRQAYAPPDSTMSKIWSLLHKRDQLISAVTLSKNIPSSSTSVEQQHGSAATVLKAHERFGKDP